MTQRVPPLLATFFVAALGVALFRSLSLPLPWLLGPMLGCLAAALAGMQMATLPTVNDTMRTVLGLAVGASITPAVVGRLDDMALSIAMVPPFIILIGSIGYPYFRKLCKFDAATSYYAAMPGGFQDMLVFGEEAGGNPRILSLVHATRVVIIVTGLPVLMTFVFQLDLDRPPGAPAREIPVKEMILMAFVALAGWRIALALNIFGAAILGPMILAAAASLSGFINHRPPAEIILAAQFFIGMGLGIKYMGITVDELRRVITAAVGYSVILAVLSAIFAFLVTGFGLAPATEAILAFSPGGQVEMAVLAIVAGADIAFVVTHHVVRIVIVIIGAPIVRRFLN